MQFIGSTAHSPDLASDSRLAATPGRDEFMAVRIESLAEPIPGYKLIERIGGGGFGEVWKCEAPGGLHKAIKFVFGDLSSVVGDEGDDGHRAKQELKALGRVKTVRHPFILTLERFDIIDGQLLIVMELAERTLWDRFKECRTQGLPGIPRDELLNFMEEAAEALDLMNNQYQLQHLDIKPQNLFIVYQHVKVADFGLVKDLEGMQASVTGGVTPVYAAPETFDGWVSRFCDQYSLAICYQELLTGQRPFAGANVRQLIMQHLQAVPNVEPLPPGDRGTIAKALAKKPDDRHPTCQDMIRLLRNASLPVQASNGHLPPVEPSVRLAQPPEREEGTRSTSTQSDATACIRRAPHDSHPGLTEFFRGAEEAVLSEPVAARAAPAEISGDGALFPSLIVGVGAVGMTILQKLRENLCRRFGSVAQAPHLRLLLLDTDPEVVRTATAGRPGAALSASEMLLAPLNRPSYYLRPRDGKPAVESWLNPRMLYRIPRSQSTTGVRALGRLAFCDNYRTIVRRLQMELNATLDPAALQTAARQSGLGLRTNRPRVYVVANLAGATGGGVFLDLAYTVAALLRQMGYAQPDVAGLLLLPPVDRCRTRVLSLGNACAALMELRHFSAPDSVFTARYHEREAPIHDAEPPFSRSILLPLPDEADEVATRELVDLASQYLYRDLCSPLGKAADLGRAELPAPPWQSRGLFYQTFGLYQLACPRYALKRETGRRLCQRLLLRWMSKDGKPLREAVQTWIQEQWARLELGSEQMLSRLRDACQDLLRQAPEDAFLAAVQPVADRCAPAAAGKKAAPPPDLTPTDAAEVMTVLEGLIGKPTDEGAPDAGGALGQRLRDASDKLVAEWGQKLAETAVQLIEEPQFRLAGAEESIRQVVASIEEILQHLEPMAREFSAKASEAYIQLRTFVAPPKAGGRRPQLSTADLLKLWQTYPKWRFQSLVLQQAASAFLSLRGHLSDEAREINFCRVRLTELQRLLETPTGAAESEPCAGRLLLPPGCKDLNEAVDGLLARVGPDALLELDGRVQAAIRPEFTALVHICLASANYLKKVEATILKTAAEFAGELLGETNAADWFLEQHPDEEEAKNESSGFFDEAKPELAPGNASLTSELCVLAAPPGPSGDRFRTLMSAALPEVEVLSATAEDDIFFYREASNLPLSELEQLGSVGQDAYRQMSATEDFTPHTRIDVDFVAPTR
jgi:eukaryotic-like serine/threonine-protein kinase